MVTIAAFKIRQNIWISGLQNDSPHCYDSNLNQMEVGSSEAAAEPASVFLKLVQQLLHL